MANPQSLLKKFGTAKTLPHVAIRLARLTADENSDIQEFEKIIKLDPTLVLRLLRLVNSPYYGLRQKVDSISRAVVFVGMKNLRNMVVTEALKDIFKERKNSGPFSRHLLFLHCAASAICCQMISERIFGQNGEDAFLCGILHDIGMIVEDQVVPDLFSEACREYQSGQESITDAEHRMIGTDHCTLGQALARDWKLPAEVQEGIKKHHKYSERMTPDSIAGVMQLSECFVTKLQYPAMPGMEPVLSPLLSEHIRDNVDEYKALTRDLPEEMGKARDLYSSEKE